jgi:hypothetical protein
MYPIIVYLQVFPPLFAIPIAAYLIASGAHGNVRNFAIGFLVLILSILLLFNSLSYYPAIPVDVLAVINDSWIWIGIVYVIEAYLIYLLSQYTETYGLMVVGSMFVIAIVGVFLILKGAFGW